jgi:hypothetical protein
MLNDFYNHVVINNDFRLQLNVTLHISYDISILEYSNDTDSAQLI